MNIGWIYPHRERCGIARYAMNYAEALGTIEPVRHINPDWHRNDRKQLRSVLDECDIVHLQYDTIAFMNGTTDFLRPLMHSIRVPTIVSLHEVYDENPLVYPRSALRGNPVTLALKKLLWDQAHPVEKTWRSHLAASFHARLLLVHHRYHREILTANGINETMVTIQPMPVHRLQPPTPFTYAAGMPLRLGGHGFIQSAYDFDLLFSTLGHLRIPWQFTWIGGTRTADQEPLHRELLHRIQERGWSDRFTITGWIDEQTLPEHLAGVDCMLALFKHRSSSASISRMLSYGKPVIATDLQMTREIADANRTSRRSTAAPLLVTPMDPGKTAEQIMLFTENGDLRLRLYEGINAYVHDHSFEKMAHRLVDLYRKLLAE